MPKQTQAQKLRLDLSRDIEAVRNGTMGEKKAKAISSLAGNQIRLAVAEIKYNQLKPTQEINFFEK